MKKNILLTLLFLFSLITVSNSQSKIKSKEISEIAKTYANICHLRIDTSTITANFVNSLSRFANLEIAKGDGHYYFVVSYGGFKNIEIRVNNSLDFILKDSEKVRLYPCSKSINQEVYSNVELNVYQGKVDNKYYSGPTQISSSTDMIYCLYEISKEQLKKLCENKKYTIRLFFTKGDHDIRGSKIDESGKTFIESKANYFTIRMLGKYILNPN